MTPSGDMPDGQAQQQSFFSLANMVPQTPELNRGVWAGIETAVRDLAAQQGELYVVTGPAFQGQQIQSIGPSGVFVPSATWKAVYSPQAGGTAVYVCANTTKPLCGVVSVATLISMVGIESLPCPARQHEVDGDRAADGGCRPPRLEEARHQIAPAAWSPARADPRHTGAPMTKLTPFADDAASLSIGSLTVENGTDRVAIYGSLELTHDKQGLAHALALKAVLDEAVRRLQAEKNLPEAAQPANAPKSVTNPFTG
jgi:hypothetical protein